MTALDKYARLEAEGLWREQEDAQRKNVIVSIGSASLIITDAQDRPLTHWSIAAIARENPGKFPALYRPDGDAGESLELAESEKQMIDAIEKLRRAVEKRRPKPGRLRLLFVVSLVLAMVALSVFWLPNALKSYALHVVPAVKQEAIGKAILNEMRSFAGNPCSSALADQSLVKLANRLEGERATLQILPDGIATTQHLPGGLILMPRELIEDLEDPDAVAGFALVELLRYEQGSALGDLLDFAGTLATFRLLTTGELPTQSLKDYALHILTLPPERVPEEAIIAAFAHLKLRIEPYAYALDITGEQSLALVEAGKLGQGTLEPSLSDSDWVRLQTICGG